MLFVLIQNDLIFELKNLSVNFDTNKALFPQFLKDRLKLTLASAYKRGKNLNLGTFFQSQYLIDYLINRLRVDKQVTFWTMRGADASKQQPQIIVYFSNGANSGTRVMARRFLIDRYCRAQTIDTIYVR